jgi:purine-binding chemotaxis protein CheW
MGKMHEEILKVLHIQLQSINACIDIKYVDRVFLLPELQLVPEAPYFLAGMINISGISIPVVDLTLLLGITRHANYSINTPVLLCSDGQTMIGIIIDVIISLASFNTTTLQMTNHFSEANPFITGLVLINACQCLLINLPHIFSLNLIIKSGKIEIDKNILAQVRT